MYLFYSDKFDLYPRLPMIPNYRYNFGSKRSDILWFTERSSLREFPTGTIVISGHFGKNRICGRLRPEVVSFVCSLQAGSCLIVMN